MKYKYNSYEMDTADNPDNNWVKLSDYLSLQSYTIELEQSANELIDV